MGNLTTISYLFTFKKKILVSDGMIKMECYYLEEHPMLTLATCSVRDESFR